MKCAIMQPTYLPWLGYFELMHNSDIFVFLDDVQFIKKSWHQRNRLKNANGGFYLTVPVLKKRKSKQKINEAVINNVVNWRRKHYLSIENSYRKSRYFDKYITELREIYSNNYTYLIEINLAVINFLKRRIGIKTPTVLSSSLNITGQGNEKNINICKSLDCDSLYDAAGAKEIIDQGVLAKEGIEVIYQDYKHPTYTQLYNGFIPFLSALDILLNEGDNSLDIICS